ncbi:MAG: GNAT family N-acetyltransferase [Planctomycetaceae bacterium]|nr:GNAT family N-acetyltransferase [Planctomycetaceae bacterium]
MGSDPKTQAKEVVIRPMGDDADFVALTAMIHRAYKQLADMGLKYWATHQPVEDTKKRAEGGETWFAEHEGRVIGTVTLAPPNLGGERGWNTPAWYSRPGVATFGQFAVEPEFQRSGIGSRLMEHIEGRARKLGAAELSMDTSEHAHHLIVYYQNRGYRVVGEADWRPKVNYKSVILSKTL